MILHNFYDEERKRERARHDERTLIESEKLQIIRHKQINDIPKILFLKFTPIIIGAYLAYQAYLKFSGRG